MLDDVRFRATSRSASRRSASPGATCSSWPRRFAVSPRLLILDEPTAPFSQDSVELLFDVRPQPRGGRDGGRLHHAPTRRGPRDRRPRHRAARREAARDLGRRRHLGRRAARADRRPHARGDVPAETHGRARRGAAASGGRAERERLREHLVHRATRARSWASPAWSATASPPSCAPSPGARRRAERSTSPARSSPAAHGSRAPPTCRPIA